MQKIVINTSIILCSLVILFALSASVNGNWAMSTQYYYLIQVMLYYLYFIILRTVILLALSFYERSVKKSVMEISHFPIVTIIIPCYNEELVIQDSIRSVEKINYPNLEILVIDDGSTDLTYKLAKEVSKEGKVRVLTKKNGGKASALNHGIEEALGDFVLCMDADSHLDENALVNALPYFEYFPNISAVAGNVRVGNVDSPLVLFQKLEYVVGLNFHKMAQSALQCVTIIPGPIGVFRRSAVLEVGCYEPNTFAEDCDLTLKLLANGHQIKYNPDVMAITEAPTEIYQLMMQRYRWSRGTIQAIVKNAKSFLSGKNRARKTLIYGYIIIETMVIPSANFLFFMFTIAVALQGSVDGLYGPFFFGLTFLDAAIALYSIFTEEEFKMLFFLAIIGRITYGLALEITRFFSMLDELFKIPMRWGEQKRQGMK